jgi:hypothetical protein
MTATSDEADAHSRSERSAVTPTYTVQKLTAIKDSAPSTASATQETCRATEDP